MKDSHSPAEIMFQSRNCPVESLTLYGLLVILIMKCWFGGTENILFGVGCA